jgi:type II secretory pathway component PulF
VNPRTSEAFFHQLAELLGAGLPWPKALAHLAESRLPGVARRARIWQTEDPLTHPTGPLRHASALEVGLLEAGQRSGKLTEVCRLLSSHYATLASARQQIRSGSIYPLVVVHLAIFLLAIPGAVLGGGPEAYVRSVLGGLTVLYALLFGAWFLWQFAWKLCSRSAAAEAWLRLLPIFGGVRRAWTASLFATTLALQVRAGTGLLAALRPAGRASGSATLRSCSEAMRQRIQDGSSLRESLPRPGLLPALLEDALATGEQSGNLAQELERAAQSLRDSLQARIAALGVWLPRVLYFFVVLYTGWRILSLAAGYYQTLEDTFSL